MVACGGFNIGGNVEWLEFELAGAVLLCPREEVGCGAVERRSYVARPILAPPKMGPSCSGLGQPIWPITTSISLRKMFDRFLDLRSPAGSGAIKRAACLLPATGDRGFESPSLQWRVRLSPESTFVGQEPRLSARVCAAGLAHSALEKVRPLLERLGQRLFVIGDDAGLANLVKIAANVLTATTRECMGEVLALMRKGGVDGHLAFDVLTNSLFDSRVHKTYGEKIIDGRYSPPGMAAPLAVQDLRLALAEAERAAVPMLAASLIHDRLVAMVARGWAGLDWSALSLLAAVDAGLDNGC